MSLHSILTRQLNWAADLTRKGHVLDRLTDNLFRPLHPATIAEFARGSGNELGLSGRTAKMRSLRSSSALVCNVFDPWRGQSFGPLVSALGVRGSFSEFAFEEKLSHGLSTTPPNLDVVLYALDATPLGIESKFAEIYDSKMGYDPIDAKYFDSGRKRWADLGLPSVQAVAETLGRSVHFRRLDAGQLLKHILGLANTFQEFRPVRLLYLWYDEPGDEAKEHADDLRRFECAIEQDVEFRAVRYQDIFVALKNAPEPSAGYIDYLARRYFAA